MKLVLLTFLALFGVLSLANGGDIFDKLDVLSIFENEAKRRQAFACLMDRAPCGKYQVIKDKCPELLRTDCAKCSPEQKVKYQNIMKKMEAEYNDEYKEIIQKFKS